MLFVDDVTPAPAGTLAACLEAVFSLLFAMIGVRWDQRHGTHAAVVRYEQSEGVWILSRE